ncbi:hypothetical protein FGO68_gene1966 [Halteria grandinella]|uniref:Uncharacterized protein n=1 Tax=Halteria grandinella TaxID=5974 RepID=A0A8J8P3S1_HALGN|nr:hypothetical protein FGO68_gene1966 [Halteria grandinella]
MCAHQKTMTNWLFKPPTIFLIIRRILLTYNLTYRPSTDENPRTPKCRYPTIPTPLFLSQKRETDAMDKQTDKAPL